jgi:hypothetical protein
MPVERVNANLYICSLCNKRELSWSKPDNWWARKVVINWCEGKEDACVLPDHMEPIDTRTYLFCEECTDRVNNPHMHYYGRPGMTNDFEVE